jgi:LysR family transcriptional regulator, glycine cleavage system transcriptional activator
MVRRYYGLPSLNALAAFEAAARHLSLTRASSELNVTAGAVSKQVKALEEELGCALFIRLHRALQLTLEGEALYHSLKETFERLALNLQEIRRTNKVRIVSIGTTNAFAQHWLMPRLGDFWNAHQDIIIDHMISDRPQDLLRADVDLRVRYGDGVWPNEGALKLFDDKIIAAASPDYVRRHKLKSLRDIASHPLLSVEGTDWTWTTWPDFLRDVGEPHKRLSVRRFNSYVIALQAAQDGQGLVLGWQKLIKPLLDRHHLVQVTDAEIVAPGSFYICWNSKVGLSREGLILRDFLLGTLT